VDSNAGAWLPRACCYDTDAQTWRDYYLVSLLDPLGNSLWSSRSESMTRGPGVANPPAQRFLMTPRRRVSCAPKTRSPPRPSPDPEWNDHKHRLPLEGFEPRLPDPEPDLRAWVSGNLAGDGHLRAWVPAQCYSCPLFARRNGSKAVAATGGVMGATDRAA